MINAINIAVSGLNAASQQADTAAANVANVTTPGSNVDLVTQAVNLDIASTEFKANAAVIRTVDQMDQSLFHMFDVTV